MKTKQLFLMLGLLFFSIPAFAQLSGVVSTAESMTNQLTQIARILCIAAFTIGGITLACSFVFASDLSQVAKKRLTSFGIALLVLAALSGIIGWVKGLTF